MRLIILVRKIHYWSTLLVAIPVLIVLVSGLLLQVKKQSDWVQPAEQKGTPTETPISVADVMVHLRANPEANVATWDEVDRLDIRPGKGLVKIRLVDGREVQMDLSDGRILQIDYRRTDLIESLHDGSWFAGDITKLGLFLPAAIMLLGLWVTGIWMFWAPIPIRRRRRRAKARRLADAQK